MPWVWRKKPCCKTCMTPEQPYQPPLAAHKRRSVKPSSQDNRYFTSDGWLQKASDLRLSDGRSVQCAC